MTLPTIKNANFTIKVKELKEPLRIRPIVFQEHKAIQQAMDLGTQEDVVMMLADVVEQCTDGVIKADTTEQYLLEYIFLQLYINSVEGKVSSTYTCKAYKKDENEQILIDEETQMPIICNSSFEVQVPLERGKIVYPENFEKMKDVEISDGVSIRLKCLSLAHNVEILRLRDEIIDLNTLIENFEHIQDDEFKTVDDVKEKISELKAKIQDFYIFYSVEKINDNGKELLPNVDFTFEEFSEWIKNIPSKSATEIVKFYNDVPILGMDLTITCPHCRNKENIKLRGLHDFFS